MPYPCCYILFSFKLNKYYVGSTPDIERRLKEHNRGKEKFTKTGLPWKLVYVEKFENLTEARGREHYIKKMKSRKFIENLISFQSGRSQV
jgi:putative endonuclease